jgi:hypothetical protein
VLDGVLVAGQGRAQRLLWGAFRRRRPQPSRAADVRRVRRPRVRRSRDRPAIFDEARAARRSCIARRGLVCDTAATGPRR